MVHLAQTVHLSYTNTNTVSKRTETTFLMTHVTKEVRSVVSKTISELMVRSVQTMDLSYVKINTISKQTKTSFQLSLVT
jgi:hypothetical protein